MKRVLLTVKARSVELSLVSEHSRNKTVVICFVAKYQKCPLTFVLFRHWPLNMDISFDISCFPPPNYGQIDLRASDAKLGIPYTIAIWPFTNFCCSFSQCSYPTHQSLMATELWTLFFLLILVFVYASLFFAFFFNIDFAGVFCEKPLLRCLRKSSWNNLSTCS